MSRSRRCACASWCASVFALVLAGCAPEPTYPPPELPRLERPVQALAVRPGERVLIPRAALVERAGVPGVFVLDEQGRARFRMVRTGKTVGARIEILSGLAGNERLVLGDLDAVRDGSPIKPVAAN